ncbi:MAG TPA: proline dehydrogenase family protein, partial [Verrucomicrobiae bacterium]|nr:proline dehydrogenase family protein [Verrucomicrobiae bacterium]
MQSLEPAVSARNSARARDARNKAGFDLEERTRQYGEQLLGLIEAAAPPSLFSRKGIYSSLMEWSFRDARFKTQLFRFIDVLPALTSNAEIARHWREYLGDEQLQAHLPAAFRLGLKAAGGASRLFGETVKSRIIAMARQFMLGNDPEEIVATLTELQSRGIGFTVDILGETVVSEVEADVYAKRCLKLMELLSTRIGTNAGNCRSNDAPHGPVPAVNLSVKISALYSQIQPAAPEEGIHVISGRLRPLLRRAKELGAFVNFDMESYAVKGLTLDLFKKLFSEPEFDRGPARGLALQTYLKECEADLRGIIDWSRNASIRPTVRLVKGAYWDYETVIAKERGWPCPVFSRKAETDANYERLTELLLEHADVVDAALGTHNVRSIARALAQAEQLGLDRRQFEFQMLHGMAEPIKAAVLQMGCRLREYCPVGELLPGMAYLVRRLLENTSNEGFLASRFVRNAATAELLGNPREIASSPPRLVTARTASFENEPHS